MTIKFWKNWQKRLKETKCIVLYHLMFADDWENNEYISNYTLKASDIISYSFNKDNVKISMLDYNTKGDRVPVTMTLKRIDIKTIIFDRYKKEELLKIVNSEKFHLGECLRYVVHHQEQLKNA